jgi:hypothetical protein
MDSIWDWRLDQLEALKLVDVAVDVANAAHHFGLGAGF